MNPKERRGKNIVFENENIHPHELKKKLNDFFGKHSQDLTQEQIEKLRGSLLKKIKGAMRREFNEKGEVSPDFKDNTLSYLLGKLESRVGFLKEKQESMLLNPELLSRKEAELEFKEIKENLSKDEIIIFCFFDLDKFKSYNDKYGHDEGDKLLRSIGTAIQKATRISDKGIHFSGDEFGIILKLDKKDKNRVEDILQRIVSDIKETIQRKDSKGQSFSMGYSIAEKEDGLEYSDIKNSADRGSRISKIINKISSINSQPSTPEKRIIKGNGSDQDIEERLQDMGYEQDKIEEAKFLWGIQRTVRQDEGLKEVSTSEIHDAFLKTRNELISKKGGE